MNKKAILLIAPLGILVLGVWGICSIPWVEGYFEFYPVNENGHDRPFYPSNYYPNHIIVNEQYQKLHIKEMSYEWEGNTGIFLKDEWWDSLYTNNKKYNSSVYDSLTGEYTYELYGISERVHKNVNLDRIFKSKKRGDMFKYTVKIVYSLDNEIECTQTIEGNVSVVMGKYQASLYRMRAMTLLPIFR